MMIIIGAGHGIGPLLVFEIVGIRELFAGNLELNFFGRYDDRLMAAALMALIGQTILITTFFFDETLQSTLNVVGCLVVLLSILF
jgi:hypothetical protein